MSRESCANCEFEHESIPSDMYYSYPCARCHNGSRNTSNYKPVKAPVVKSLHPAAEKVAKLLFGIEKMPRAEAKKMVNRAVKYIHKVMTEGLQE